MDNAELKQALMNMFTGLEEPFEILVPMGNILVAPTLDKPLHGHSLCHLTPNKKSVYIRASGGYSHTPEDEIEYLMYDPGSDVDFEDPERFSDSGTNGLDSDVTNNPAETPNDQPTTNDPVETLTDQPTINDPLPTTTNTILK